MNIICFPHAGGQASTFNFLKKEKDFNVIAYEYNAHGSKMNEVPYKNFDDAIKTIANDIVQMDVDDIALFGHSMGAYVAYETAYLLEKQYHKKVSAVIVSGQISPGLHKQSNVKNISDSQFLEHLISMGGMNDEVKNNQELLEMLLPIIRLDYNLLDTYQADETHIINSPLYVFAGSEDKEVLESDLSQWKHFSRNFKEVLMFSGNHFYMNNNQEQLLEAISAILSEKSCQVKKTRYIWAPTVKWSILEENRLKIANFIFKGEYTKLFPKFYDVAKQGVTLDELEGIFEGFSKQKLNKFVKKLLATEILIKGIQQIDALFYSQNHLFSANHPIDDEIKINAQKLNDFKAEQLSREANSEHLSRIKLLANNDIFDELKCRKTIREFDKSTVVSFDKFSNLLSCLMQRNDEQEIKYFYPSAGGLYPIDIFIYVKSGRVKNVEGGLYYYMPKINELALVSEDKIEKSVHYFQNQEIFDSSAFSVFLVYNAYASMPKYGGMAYFYGIVEAGIICELLSVASEKLGLGSCIIGEMDYRSIVESFKLNDNNVYMLCMEFGNKMNLKKGNIDE